MKSILAAAMLSAAYTAQATVERSLQSLPSGPQNRTERAAFDAQNKIRTNPQSAARTVLQEMQ